MKKKLKIFYMLILIVFFCVNISYADNTIVNYTYDNLNQLTEIEYGNGDTISYTYDAAGNRLTRIVLAEDIVAPQTFASPAGCSYISEIFVTLSADETATIYYTTDGSDPDTGSSVYSIPLVINSDTTLKFFGMDAAGNPESINTEIYTFNPSPATIFGLPSNPTTDHDFTVSISGDGVVAYKYRLDGGAWSGETDVAVPIELVNINEGSHQLEVIGQDAFGNWQEEVNTTIANWEISIILAGDINDDGEVDLTDCMLAMQITSGIVTAQNFNIAADVNGDDKIGIEEVIYILGKVVGERE